MMYCIFKYLYIFLFLQFSASKLIKNDENEINYFPELKYVDENVDPCENFYKFSCGNFDKYNPKPDNELYWDNFKKLQKEINDQTIKILNTKIRKSDPDAVKKAKDMYQACLTPSLSSEQSIKPLSDTFNELGGWPLVSNIPKSNIKFSWDHIGKIISRFGLPVLLNWDIVPYYMNSSMNMLRLSKDSLVLPASSITYLEDSELNVFDNLETHFKNKIQRHPYMQYLIDVAKKFVRPDLISVYEEQIIEGIEEMYEILMKISSLQKTTFDNDDYIEIDNIKDLQDWTDGFSANFITKINWLTFFKEAFANTDVEVTENIKIYVSSPAVIKTILTIVEETRPDIILNFVFARLVSYTAQDTNYELWEMFNNLYRQLNYTVYAREEYCMRKVINYPNIGLSLAVAHEIQNYYFDLKKISKPEKIIEDMQETFLELLNEKNWIDEYAKKWVRRKIDKMLRLIAFPDYVYDRKKLDNYYSSLRICLHDHYGNSQNIRAFSFAKDNEVIDKPKRRDIWTQSPLTVNAFYTQLSNKITFPSGIMHPPFFTGISRLVDYSRIGALIGHEITHGFDSSGRYIDENGSYLEENIWNDTVNDAFNNITQCFINQYSNYHIEEINLNVNGVLTNTENIADNGGIRQTFRAFQNLNRGSSYAPEKFIGKYTPEQLFFISYATMWCKIDTKESLAKMYKYDKHAPNRFRVIGTLSNMKEFSDVFNCSVDSKMNPRNKCVLW